MKRAILIGFGLAVLAAVGVVGWNWRQRIGDLERRLAEADRRGEMLDQQLRRTGRDLGEALERATESDQSAEAAARRAEEAALRAQEATVARSDAESRRQKAEETAQQSRRELSELQKRREQELNRMQEALARIAATRRTGSGMVIDLTSDSFSFDFDKATLKPENREILSRIAGVLLVSSGYRLSVHGHTDDVGTPEYNRELSERRAASVADYLIAAGIDRNVIETRGFGKSSPRAQGKTSAARQQNRRVEIVVVDSVIHYGEQVTDPAQ